MIASPRLLATRKGTKYTAQCYEHRAPHDRGTGKTCGAIAIVERVEVCSVSVNRS